MQFVFLLLGILAALKGIASIFDGIRFRKTMRARLAEHHVSFSVPATIIVPCKGLDPGFEANIQSILEQDYPNYSVILVSESTQDRAFSELEALARGSQIDTTVIVAGPARESSQKIHNLLAGLRHVADDTEILVFADSDIRANGDWLQHLVAPLQQEAIGATTGYRWYVPIPGNFWSAVRSVWNMTSANLLFNETYNFAWGGSMAIRKKTFAELAIAEKWRTGLSDDMIVTNAIKAAGYQIKFVPQCLVASLEKTTFRSLVDWVARQLTMIRLYDPALWKLAAYPQWAFSLIFICGIVLIISGLLTNAAIPFAAWLMISDAVLGGVINGVRFSAFLRALPPYRNGMRHFGWAYVSLHLIASLVMSLGLFKSRKANRIIWRGIEYGIRPSGEIVVLNGVSFTKP